MIVDQATIPGWCVPNPNLGTIYPQNRPLSTPQDYPNKIQSHLISHYSPSPFRSRERWNESIHLRRDQALAAREPSKKRHVYTYILSWYTHSGLRRLALVYLISGVSNDVPYV